MRLSECLKSVGKILHGNICLWSMMKKSSVSRMRLCILRFCVMSWKGESETNIKYFGKNSWVGSKIHHTELWTQLTENRWNSSGIFSQDSPHCSSSTKSKSSWTRWTTQRNSKGELSSWRCSMTSCGDLKTLDGNAMLMPRLCLFLQKNHFQQDDGHSSDLDQKQSGILLKPKDHKEHGTESLNWWWSKFRERGHPVFRTTRPLSRGTLKSKGRGKLSIHFCADGDTIESVFRTFISVNQPSIYGAVSDVCEEYKACQVRTARPVLARQSDPLFEPATFLILTPDLRLKFNEWKGFRSKMEW